MERTEPWLASNDLFYASPLAQATRKDIGAILDFQATKEHGEGLVLYLQHHAARDEESGNMRTYLVKDADTDELAGYFSLKAGLISINEREDGDGNEFDTVGAVEIANFAIEGGYREKHPESHGCGRIILQRLILPIIQEAANRIGIGYVYIYALPYEDLISHYEKLGFRRLPTEEEALLHQRQKPRYDKQCIFMYMELPRASSAD